MSAPYFAVAAPPLRLYAKSVKERSDRKWMWLVPACKAGSHTHNGGSGSERNTSSATISGLTIVLPPDTDGASLAALSYFAMVSPGARLRHTLDGEPLTFQPVRASFLAQSWGYLQRWHVLDAADHQPMVKSTPPPGTPTPKSKTHHGNSARRRGQGAALAGNDHAPNARGRLWQLCTEHVPNERCIGFRCGLEFKMPMKTAAVGWFLTLTASRPAH